MSTIIVLGRGRNFTFNVFDPHNTRWNHLPGVYGFATRGLLGVGHIYFGECESFADRMANHERWPEAASRGASVIIAMVTPAHMRFSIEQELIALHNPVMNTQHRTVPDVLVGLLNNPALFR